MTTQDKPCNIGTMSKEYIVWGIPPHKTEEEVLYTKATTMAEAVKVRGILEHKHGCTKTRTQILDLTQPLDWEGKVIKALQQPKEGR